MKMPYEKPMMAIERYELTQSIALCDKYKIGFNSPECVIRDSDSPNQMRDLAFQGFFSDGCGDLTVAPGPTDNGICYHTNANAAFTS